METYNWGLWSRDRVYQGKNNLVADELSHLPNKKNQNTKHNYNYTTETMSEIYDINEIPERTFPVNF